MSRLGVFFAILAGSCNSAAELSTRTAEPVALMSMPSSEQVEIGFSEAAGPRVARGSSRSLVVPGFESAVLYVPVGDRVRPLLVAAHGAGGSPEWECDYWRRLIGERAFLLCLRGTPLGANGGFFFRDQHALEKELLSAERAARASEPRIASGAGVYAGFSQGSSMGSAIIAPHGATFPYLVLIEGFELWNVPRARSFARAGGKRVLFACGSKECAKVAAASVRWLKAAGVEAKLEYGKGTGHSPLGEVLARIESSLPWLLSGDEWWR
jgi:predicted esterase